MVDVLMGLMVDLDNVISGNFAFMNDNCKVKELEGMEVKFGVSKPIKQVKTSGDWFIGWGSVATVNDRCFGNLK